MSATLDTVDELLRMAEAIESLDKAATPAPWHELHHGSPREELLVRYEGTQIGRKVAQLPPDDQGHADATLLALLRNHAGAIATALREFAALKEVS